MEKINMIQEGQHQSIPVTVIGLGLMGHALAHTFLKAGQQTTIWNRSPKKAEDLVTEGAIYKHILKEAVSASTLLVTCVSTYEVLTELLAPVKEDLPGRIIINLTSGTPDDARNMAKWVAESGADYLDGAIMAVPPLIGSPEVLIFYGGSQEVFEDYEPVLKLLGGNTIFLSTDPGVALLYDLALLTILYGVQQSWLHAHAMINTIDVTASAFQPFVEEWLKNVILPGYTTHSAGQMLDEADYKTEVSNLHTNMLALDHIVKASRELGIPSEWMTPLQNNYHQLVKGGYGSDSPERVFEIIRHHQ